MNQQITPDQISVEFEDGIMKLSVNGEVVRTVSPIHGKSYSFKIDGEECHFIYQDYNVRNHNVKRIWLYPINMFTSNMVSL